MQLIQAKTPVFTPHASNINTFRYCFGNMPNDTYLSAGSDTANNHKQFNLISTKNNMNDFETNECFLNLWIITIQEEYVKIIKAFNIMGMHCKIFVH